MVRRAPQFLHDAQLEVEILESHLNHSDTNPHQLGFRPTAASKAEQAHLEKMEAKSQFGFYESFWSTVRAARFEQSSRAWMLHLTAVFAARLQISPSIRRLAQTPKTPWSTNGRSPRTPGVTENGNGAVTLPPRQDSFQLDAAPTIYHHEEAEQSQR